MRKNYFLKLSLIAITVVLLFSCEKSGHEAIYFDAGINLIVKDSEGNDLLNPNNPNAINVDNIKIIHEINDEQVVYFDEFMDAPRGFRVYEKEGVYYLSVLTVTSKYMQKSITYVQWSEDDTDKLICEIEQYKTGSTFICKVWLNDELVWTPSQGERFIEIIK